MSKAMSCSHLKTFVLIQKTKMQKNILLYLWQTLKQQEQTMTEK